jgi:hypothetical protein
MLGEKMYPYFEEYLRSVAEARCIEIEDVRAIRCVLDEEVATDRSVIETLIELDRSATGGPEWRDFLSETIADFVVWVEGPLGEVTAEASAWLIAALRGPSGVPAPSAASVVHAVIGQAEETHSSLSLFALSTPCGASWTRPGWGSFERSADFVM